MSDGPDHLDETIDAAVVPTGDDDLVAPSLAAGMVLAGRWEVLGLLGSGGMGSVYRARDRELDEIVAVKVLRRELARTPAMLERFRREVKLARRVTHPNVARTFDIGEHDELRFISMEVVEARPLSRILAGEGPLPVARIAAVGRAICAGLAAAHEAGVVHRDLKPDNVLVDRTGRVVLTDFGIARALEATPDAGQTQGGILGTPLYMAPEQITHDVPIGPATDLYALGCMLFEMATGRPPWTGPTPIAIAAARLVGEPPDPATLVPDLPVRFVDLVRRLLARRAGARPGSALEVAEALEQLASSIAVTPSLRPIGMIGASTGQDATRATPSGRPSSGLSGVGLAGMGLAGVGGSTDSWGAIKSVAVLPIENRGNESDAYLAAGLTDDLVDLLSGSPGLRVRPRAVAERAARSGEPGRDPREVGRELDVQVVVTGELRRHGDVLQASVRVVTVDDGFQLWAGRFRTPAEEFLRIGDEAAAAIAAALTAPRVAPRAAPTDPRALDLYLRGRYLLRRSWGATPEAMPLLREAVERAPQDPAIRLTYARALVRGVAIGELPAEATSAAWTIIDETLRADPDLADARHARAALHLMRGDIIDGIADLRAALRAAPDLDEALASLGDVMTDAGAVDGARVVLERAIALDPGHLLPRMVLARLHGVLGDFEGAIRALGDPPVDHVDAGTYWVVRSRMALWADDRAEAATVRARYVDVAPPGFLREVCRFVTAVVLGDFPRDDRLVRGALGTTGGPGPRIAAFHLQMRAEVLARLGDRADAIAAVIAAEETGAFDVLWAERCPALDPIRDDLEARAAFQRIGSRAERIRLALGDLALPRRGP